MKIWIGVFLLGVSAAHAEIITLGPVGCGITFQCLDIPTDTGAVVSLYSLYGNQLGHLYIDGISFSGANQINNGSPYQYVQGQFADANGVVVLLDATFSTFRSCTGSGRGQHCSTHWNLLGGRITR